MSLTSVFGFLSLAGWIMVLAGGGIAITNTAQSRSPRPGIALSIAGLAVGIVFFFISTGLVIVGPTEVAVVFQSFGGDPANHSLWKDPLGPGVHIVIPVINEPIVYSTEVRTYTMSKTPTEGQQPGDDSISVLTQDGQQISIDASVLYHIDPLQVNQVHIKFQNRYEADFVRPIVQTAVRDVVAKYNVVDIYGPQRAVIQTEIETALKPDFPPNGLILDQFLLRNIAFSDQYVKAIEAKNVALQQAEQAKEDAVRAKTVAQGQADAAVAAADGDAQANIARANGDATAIVARAKADAEALGLISEQLLKDPQLIQWRYIEKLGQDVKLVLIPSNSPFLFSPSALTDLGSSNSSQSTPAVTPPAAATQPTATPTASAN